MSPATTTGLPEIIKRREQDLLERWIKEQLSAVSPRRELLSESQLREQSREFLGLVAQAAGKGNLTSVDAPAWQGVRDMLGDLSRSRAAQGFSPSETATFVFSLKQPLFDVLRQEYDGQAATLTDELWTASAALDRLGLYTTEVYQKGREEVILRQQQEMLELSTPVVKLWDGVLALPMIGTLDSARTQVVMESPAAAHRRDRCRGRHHRHHRRAHGGYAGGAAPAEDDDRRPAHGRRVHHQRHPASDRRHDRASRRGPERGDHQGHARRRVPGGAEPAWTDRAARAARGA